MSYPRRNAATQRFTLGAPRNISVSRNGERILFCRSTAGDDPVNRLWVIDLPATEPRLLVDPLSLLGGGEIELTDASFVLGVASLIQLIDAQAQRLAAALAYTNALYDFLESMIAAERELSFFPFLEDDAEVTALLDQIEQQVTTGP